MRFSISREKFQDGLTSVLSVVPTKSTLPVLGNVLLETTDRGIRFSGTDLDIAVSAEVVGDVEEVGALTVPGKKLGEISRELSPDTVRVSSIGEQRISIESGRSRFRLVGLPRDEFPSFPTVQFAKTWQVKAGEFQKLIGHTAFAVSMEESRPILNGVLWEFGAGQMRMVATNGHRLAKMEIDFSTGTEETTDLILPPKALDQIRRLFPAEENLEIGRGENHVAFRSPFGCVYTRLIEGPYPNYDQVIPKDNDRSAIVDREPLSSALRRMSIVASDQTHRVKLSFNTGLLKFSAQTPDLGEAQDEIPVQYSGDPLDIGFNGAYLLEILRFMPTESVKLTFKGAERAATVEPYQWNDSAKYMCLVMPLRLVD